MRTRLVRMPEKISAELESRLRQLSPTQKVRALVVLEHGGRPLGRRTTAADRVEILESARRVADRVLPEIEEILKRHHGRRLGGRVSALGFVPVETTAKGLKELASSPHISAIIEDQPISLALSGPPRRRTG